MPGSTASPPKVALVLSGGGARAAYQVGVVKAIAEMLPRDAANPFPILCGTSAGAINATALAIYARSFSEGVRRLNYVWKNFEVEQVFRADTLGIARTGAHWLAALAFAGLGRRNPQSLLDRAPLQKLLDELLPCEKIQASLDAGALRALSITASGYGSGQSVTFFQASEGIKSWERANRVGCAMPVTIDHLMASSAIPLLFAPVRINREHFGDGSMRQTAPLSAAIHLGAERVLVIGTRREKVPSSVWPAIKDNPSLAQIAGHVLDSIFLDALEADLERLQRINKTISLISARQMEEHGMTLRPVEPLVISPSESLAQIAAKHARHLPRPVRILLRGIGAFNRSGATLVSYLLFERPFTRELIGLGYADTMMRRAEILPFLGFEPN